MGKREILLSHKEFSNKASWDEFYAGRGLDDSFEWYAEWAELGDLIVSQLAGVSPTSQILVPGSGDSRLSEHLYDAGFRRITNIDISQVAISNMSLRNGRRRPFMRWRVMDMSNMQFMDESFEVIIDKGGLDALMEAEDAATLANQYLSEVKRVMKSGGKFICFTFAEPHVLEVLLSKLRFGWKTSVVAVPPSAKLPSYPSFMVVSEKDVELTSLHPLVASLSLTEGKEVHEAIEKESRIREGYKVKENYLCEAEKQNPELKFSEISQMVAV